MTRWHRSLNSLSCHMLLNACTPLFVRVPCAILRSKSLSTEPKIDYIKRHRRTRVATSKMLIILFQALSQITWLFGTLSTFTLQQLWLHRSVDHGFTAASRWCLSSDPRPHPAAAGVATVRELRPYTVAFPTAAALLLASGNRPQYLWLQRWAVVFEVIKSLSPDHSCRYIRASGMLYSSNLFGHHRAANDETWKYVHKLLSSKHLKSLRWKNYDTQRSKKWLKSRSSMTSNPATITTISGSVPSHT